MDDTANASEEFAICQPSDQDPFVILTVGEAEDFVVKVNFDGPIIFYAKGVISLSVPVSLRGFSAGESIVFWIDHDELDVFKNEHTPSLDFASALYCLKL